MGSFYYPSSGSVARYALLGLFFFTSSLNVGGVTLFQKQSFHFHTIVPFIQTYILRFITGWDWSMYNHFFQRSLNQSYIMLVGCIHRHRQGHGNATSIYWQTAFSTPFASVGGHPERTQPGPLPHQVELWLLPNPWLTTPSRYLSYHHIRSALVASAFETLSVRTTIESGHGPYWLRLKSGAKLSICSPFVKGKRWPSWLAGHSFSVGQPFSWLLKQVSSALFRASVHQEYCKLHQLQSLVQSCGSSKLFSF